MIGNVISTMSPWMAAAGLVGSKLLDNWSARSNARYQNELSLDQYRATPAAQMQGFREAGLNPMLAFQNTSFAPSAPVAPVASDLTASATGVFRAQTERDQADSVIALQRNQAKQVLLQAGLTKNALDESTAFLDAMASSKGFNPQWLSGTEREKALVEFAKAARVDPELQDAAARVAERLNDQQLHDFVNAPGANMLMQFGQMLLRLVLGLRGSTTTVNRHSTIQLAPSPSK